MRISLLLLTLLFTGAGSARAQDSGALPDLMRWVANQQAQVGTSISLHGTKYACTWWDAFSYGQAGMSAGKAGALDYVDLGPGVGVANDKRPRWGQTVAIHVGNIWNTLTGHLPAGVGSHVHFVALPKITVAPVFLLPERLPLNKWTWREDFQVAIAYKFGGTP